MAKPADETLDKGAAAPVIRSQGEEAASAYAAIELPEEPVHPTMEMDRVQIIDPRHSPTAPPEEARRGSGPRAPEQMTLPKPKEAIELPMARPATKMQRIDIDPELLMKWEREAQERKAAKLAAAGEPPPSERAPPPVDEAPAAPEEITRDRVTEPMRPKAPPAAIASMELPSALAPSSQPEPVAEGASAAGSRGRLFAFALAALGVVLLAFVLVKMSEPVDGPLVAATGAGPSAAPAPPVVASSPPAAAQSATPSPSVAPTASAALPDAPAPEVSGGVVPLAPPAGTAPKKTRPVGEDPYDAAPPPATKTVEVVAPPPPAMTTAPTTPPPATATPTAAPKAPPAASSGRILGSDEG